LKINHLAALFRAVIFHNFCDALSGKENGGLKALFGYAIVV
jgi:hypothetical protein